MGIIIYERWSGLLGAVVWWAGNSLLWSEGKISLPATVLRDQGK